MKKIMKNVFFFASLLIGNESFAQLQSNSKNCEIVIEEATSTEKVVTEEIETTEQGSSKQSKPLKKKKVKSIENNEQSKEPILQPLTRKGT